MTKETDALAKELVFALRDRLGFDHEGATLAYLAMLTIAGLACGESSARVVRAAIHIIRNGVVPDNPQSVHVAAHNAINSVSGSAGEVN